MEDLVPNDPTRACRVELGEADGRTPPEDLGFDPEDLDRPVLVWDGKCGFCKRSLDYISARAGDQFDAVPYQHVHGYFDDIDVEDFERAVHLVEPGGIHYSGADAIFRTLELAPNGGIGRWCYDKIPLFAEISKASYRWVAENRPLVDRVTRSLWGEDLRPSSFGLARWLFFRAVGLVFVVAFISLWVQIDGLIGSQGITPAADYMERLAETATQRDGMFWRVPTLFWWIPPSDWLLHVSCGVGTALGVALTIGCWPRGTLAALWALYLSLLSVGGPFLSYQWDILLLEVAFLGLFLAPSGLWTLRRAREPSRVAVFLFHWLAFRLMFMSGIVKLTSRDPVWRDGSALTYHFWTQPLPSWTAYWVHQLPELLLQLGTWATLMIEIAIPVLVFLPRRLRQFAAAAFFVLQLAILATGNYGFFNILTMAVCLLLVEDRVWHSLGPTRLFDALERGVASASSPGWRRLRTVALTGVAAAVVVVTGCKMGERFGMLGEREGAVADVPGAVDGLVDATRGFRTLNNYGLFADMTVRRPEIIVQGSRGDGEWKTYRFPWKPDAVTERPRFVQPHQPRLDWQMWFQALRLQRAADRTGQCGYNGWFVKFLRRLLRNDRPVTNLLRENPFPEEPPTRIRTVVYDYEFAAPSGEAWWKRGERRSLCPTARLTKAGKMQFERR